ncbi:aldo-keto reductase [Tremella mesenterica]|uniref:Aldo-keto reductase n=1 Tax=Tremella mesenterica TaxID=5217 RepID=A0A4Q1BRM7_TREME|nr:aldo-keto reductase [Tremella mesenterica]
MVKTLSFADISVPVPGFGAMGFSQGYGPAKEEESFETMAKAVEIGCTFWDTAAVYGCGHNETLMGEFLKKNNCRDKMFIASKCGFEIDWEAKKPLKVTNSAEHIKEYIEGSIKRLGTTPDLYYLHRIEPGRDLNESIGALDAIRKAGKCKYIGLSECNATTLRKACQIAKIDALQIEYSPWFTDHEQNGLIDTAREFGVAIIAYSPLGKGVLTGKYTSPDQFTEGDTRKTIPRFSDENLKLNLRIVEQFKALSEKKGCTPGQLALAWVAAQGALAIPGTKSVNRLIENFGAREVDLSEDELKEIRAVIEDAKPVGERYGEVHLKAVGH